jgi:hypothetical protein
MFRYDTGSDTDTGFRNFFGFQRKSTWESIEVRENAKLVMGDSDIGSDKNRLFRLFRFSIKIDKGIDLCNFLVMFRSDTGYRNYVVKCGQNFFRSLRSRNAPLIHDSQR